MAFHTTGIGPLRADVRLEDTSTVHAERESARRRSRSLHLTSDVADKPESEQQA